MKNKSHLQTCWKKSSSGGVPFSKHRVIGAPSNPPSPQNTPPNKKNETTSTTTAKPTSNETSGLPKALPGICVESWLRWDPTRHLSHDESHAKALSSKQLAQHLRIPREKKKQKEWKHWNLKFGFFSGNSFLENWGGISMILYVLGVRCEVPRENGVI